MNKWLELLIGLILVIVPIWAVMSVSTFVSHNWAQATLDFLKGGVVSFIILVGLLFIMLGISDLKG